MATMPPKMVKENLFFMIMQANAELTRLERRRPFQAGGASG